MSKKKINFTPPCPAGFANFRGAGQDLLFCGAGQPFFRGAGRPSLGATSISDGTFPMEICLLRMTFYINFYLTSILSLYTVCDVILLLHCFKIYYMCRCVCNWSQTDRSFNCITLFGSKEVNFLYTIGSSSFYFGGISFLWEKHCKDCEHCPGHFLTVNHFKCNALNVVIWVSQFVRNSEVCH